MLCRTSTVTGRASTTLAALALQFLAAPHPAAADTPAARPESASAAAAVSPAVAARLRHAFGTDGAARAEGTPADWAEVLSNGDAFVRANLPLSVSNHWRSFVYADLGAADSELRWQGLAGMHHRLGVDLLAGWRHVTYHFSPGRGFDSLEFKGPYLGASLAW
jgi:hypothetical protein